MDNIEEILKKNTLEFETYQKYLQKEFEDTINELFTEEVLELIKEYTLETNMEPVSENKKLWITRSPFYHIRIEENPNNEEYEHFDINYTKIDYKPISVYRLKECVGAIHKYERLLQTIKEEAPNLIKNLFEWKEHYTENTINYLNNLDFSIPKEVYHINQ